VLQYLYSRSEQSRDTCQLYTNKVSYSQFCELDESANTRRPSKLSNTPFAPMANLSVCASVIPDRVLATLGVSSSVYLLTTRVTNYVAPVFSEGSLTRWTEDGQSSLVGSVENSTCNCMLYSGLPASHNLSSGWCLWGFSL